MTDTYTPTQEKFDRDTETGVMEILLDTGLYRHLRIRFKNGGFGWFDIVTWPGKLVITGDCETFTFARINDMFEFFRAGGYQINPGYWQEKILDGGGRARSFDWDRFRAEALAEFDEAKTDDADHELRAQARADLESEIDSTEPDKWGAVQLLREYAYRPDGYGERAYFQFDLSESPPDGEGWDYHYIWCCRAIAWAVRRYDEQSTRSEDNTEDAPAPPQGQPT